MTTVATPDCMNRMNTTLVVRPDQPARADAMAVLSLPSRSGDSLHAPQRPISMASNPRMHASTGSELKPVADTSLIGAVLRRIKAVKVGRGLWLKPGAKVKS